MSPLLWLAALTALLALAPGVRADEEPEGPRKETQGFAAVGESLVEKQGDPLEGLEGKPVRSIRVVTTGTMWKSSPKLQSIKLGDPLDGALLRRAIRELVERGGFAQVDVEAEAFEDGVALRLLALPRRLIANIKLEGNILDRSRTLGAAGLADGGEITEPSLRDAKTKLRALYRRYGYDDARIEITTSETDAPTEVLLSIVIEPGEQKEIARRIFVIEPRYDRVVGDLKYEYSVETGDTIDEDELIDADNELADDLREEGFIDASVKHRVLRRDGHAFLYVYLDSGPRYVFRFEGNRRYEASELEASFGLEKGTADASAESLSQLITTFYRERGLFDVRVEASEQASADDAVREIAFRIHEGKLVRVTKRIIPCMPKEPPSGLGAAALSREIDAFLREDLPSMPLFHQVDELALDSLLGRGGSRADARRLQPASTYTPESYERALEHVRKLLNSKGYLNAVVGPVSIIRAECDPRARGGVCRPIPMPDPKPALCRKDAQEIPIAEDPLDASFACTPDPLRSISCAPEMALHIPVQLGPQTVLYDIVFEGNSALNAQRLMEIADFPLGAPFSNVELDSATARILTAYRDEGYAYATVRADVDTSPDKTRARARFVINEHKPVIITGYEVQGAERTDEGLIISRLELCQDLDECSDDEKYYKRELVRRSEEQIATLGTFTSVTISLEDPEIPQERKRVIITVVEERSQYIEPRIGFSTGEGFKGAFEYGHRNIGGEAISLTVRLELAFLPDFLILDSDVRSNYQQLTVSERLERRNSISLRFPNVGLGPKVDLVFDGVDVRDNQRDFGLSREALIPTLSYRYGYESEELLDRMVSDEPRPKVLRRSVTQQTGLSAEVNDVTLFGAESLNAAIQQNASLGRLLRVPEGRTIAVAQRLGLTWDRRDNALAATMGTLVNAGVEHVSAFPLDDSATIKSEFLKFTARGAFYLPLTKAGMSLAFSLAAGYNLQLRSDSETYPDRLFYLGGVNSVRGFQLDEMVPDDLAQRILDGELVIDDVGVRGGDLFVNPRTELRIPLTEIFGIGIFLDTGNVWKDPASLTTFADLLKLRYTAGAGLRLTTPIGPVALDYGFKLVRYDWEDLGALHFSIGLF